MEALLQRQQITSEGIEKIVTNYKKDSPTRKTPEYAQKRLDALEALWNEFEANHKQLSAFEDQSNDYFTTKSYDTLRKTVQPIQDALQTIIEQRKVVEHTETGRLSKTDELISRQTTNFRAFSRMLRNFNIETISEKWELEDKLQMLQTRWKVIDETHWQIDNLLIGANLDYEEQFTKNEAEFEATKRELHRKLNATTHQQRSLPPVEIPTFTGNYAQWPTFMDLYCEAIHKNPTLSPGQKMQHLKGKLRGEAERIVQHLTVSADNYEACWEILTHRYNNKQLLFTRQIQTFINQPLIQHQTSLELKRLYDTSLETIHAIHNLGIETMSWDPILVHILTGKLDSETYASYMETRKQPRELPTFDEFMEFLQRKFTALEPINKKKQPFVTATKPVSPNKDNIQPSTRAYPQPNKPRNFSGRTYHVNIEKNCPLCKGDHFLPYCQSFKQMEPDAKLKTISQLNVCKNCMYSHNGKRCTSVKRCRVCNCQHHTSLHDVLRESDSLNLPTESTSSVTTTSKVPTQRKANHVTGEFNEVLLATALLKIRSTDGTYLTLRCLLDQGSQINLITETAAQRLGLQRRKQNATISGIGVSANQSNGTVQLVCESLFGDYSFNTEALVMSKMLSNLPNYTFGAREWPHLQNIHLADPEYNVSRPVDLLLDAGIYADIVMAGVLRGSTQAPIAQQTKLGWVLLGNVKTFNCHVILNNIEDISRFWEMEDIAEPSFESSENKYCETLYNNTTRRNEEGRYEVKIPMKPNFEQDLGASRPQAIAQFRSLERKFTKNEDLSNSYKEFINEYLKLGHMKKCTITREPSCILPHHGVLRPDSTTTKLRVVFNASTNTSSGHSLNALMECGPNIQQDIQAILMRWRTFQFVYTADIEKFYRQILVCEEDQHLQKIVWRENETDPIKEYQLCTVTYGTKAAPFLAIRTIQQLVKDDGHKYPLAASILQHQLYVDDLLGGSNTIEDAQKTQGQLIDIMKGGGFNLRKWASNNPKLLENLPENLINQNMISFKHAETNKTLGINWNPCADQFSFKHNALDDKSDVTVITKRQLLSDISKLYDPLGWLSPITVKAKLIFQQTWTSALTWNDPIPDYLQREWEQFRQELPQIDDLEIPRWLGNTVQSIELHGFSDASEKAYACAIYCKSIDSKGNYVIKLVAGKTKLAPLRQPISLPKLELCGAQLLSKLMKKTIESINVNNVTVYGWTDSMVVLGWLQGDPSRWKIFVSNRVVKITEIMPATCWRHVKSEDNPVDCASRGLTPSQLLSHPLWWQGPAWLNSCERPIFEPFNTDAEVKNTKQACTSIKNTPLIDELIIKHSSMTRVTRILSWILRFVNNARKVKNAKQTSHLTTSDVQNARNAIIKATQLNHFADEITQLSKHKRVHSTSSVLKLNPILDEDNILRVGGRLQHSNLKQEQKHPIILPYKDKLTELLIDQAHKETLHGGARLTLSHLRSKYWLISGLRAVKKQLLRCVTCHRFKTANNNQLMADLPPQRVTPSRPFTHTGVDFTGHVEVKANKGRGIKTMKAYVAVFVCLCTKALHLELVSDLSTAAFLNALKRLCARRGKPQHFYSDNGTNFVGAARMLEKQRKEALQQYVDDYVITTLSEWGIEWHFNAPAWPTAGGLWEAAVKSVKHHLKRVLGDQKLTFEEFSTLLTQIEGCLNSRPLVALTENTDNIECLTPAHFLIRETALEPPLSTEGNDMTYITRWQLTEKMFKDFWKRWSNEYLHTLQARSKWHYPSTNLEVGDVVLVKEDNIPPAKWVLGRVLETHPGSDGRVRVVTLKTKTTNIKRPVTKLSRLPLEPSPATVTTKTPGDDHTEKANTSRSNEKRRTKTGKVCVNLLYTALMIFFMCVGPTTQQMINVTELSPSRIVYFDKVADVKVIQDEWRMVVYYNMTTYWRSLNNIQNYVNHLTTLCKTETAFLTIAFQYQHELNEIQHHNDIFRSEHGSLRKRRGLINGIGYLANSLFGTLDERFANQYAEDINIIQSNENHLLNLYKNHTSIIEGEYNILKRNEEVMNNQFRIINEHLAKTQESIQVSQDNAMYTIATALAVNLLISNIRQIQQQLLDLVTDVKDGRIDTNLIKPDEFEEHLNIISGQLPSDLSLPCVSTFRCTPGLYKLARVHVRLTSAYLIFEVKLPLINREQYELNRMIPIPQISGNSENSVTMTSDYLAVNLRRDMIIPLDDRDVTSCIQFQENNLLCVINQPIYDIKGAKSLCEAQIINNGDLSACRTRISDCSDKWVRLHSRGAWLFSCCEDCTARIFCPAGVTSQHLRGTGIITLDFGCMLKGESFIIHARNDYHSELKLTYNEEKMYIRESNINNILTDSNHTFIIEDHKEALKELKNRIERVKEQQQMRHTTMCCTL